MKLKFSLLLLVIPFMVFSQKKGKSNEGKAPMVKMYAVKGDSLKPIDYLIKDKENRLRISVEGGMENVKHIMTVTSKHAIIKPDPAVKNEYLVIPQNQVCEIIVDVQTFENYYGVSIIQDGNKKGKRVIKTYPPKTYMIGYEKFRVR